MFHTYLAVAYLYLLFRMILPLPLSWGWRLGIATGVLIISKHHLITQMIYGNMFSPEVPFIVIAIVSWGFCAFVLLIDIVGLLLALIRRRGISKLVGQRLRYGLIMLAMILSGVGVFQAAQVPQVKRVELNIKGPPASMEGFRIVQLTDLHISRFFEAPWVQQVVSRTNAIQPDLILITGDLIDGTMEARQKDVMPLANLHAKHGVFVIPGNHEYYFDNDKWMTVYKELGMQVLLNEHSLINIENHALIIAGITDQAAYSYGMDGPDMNAALAGAPKEAPIILMHHRPAGAREYAKAGVDVQLSGHTHGGMIRGFDKLLSYANEGYISGSYMIDGMHLYVSNGTGLWNGFPIRLGVPAEITEFTLNSSYH